MSRNIFVYPHPINVFIIKHLEITVDEFCELHGYSQSTVATWISRNKSIESLPCSFIYSLSLASSLPMDTVYDKLLEEQAIYEKHLKRHRNKKKKATI